jgi:hypothetical protein
MTPWSVTPMKLNRDTREAVLFFGGLVGIASQAILSAFGYSVSLALLGVFSGMSGLPYFFAWDDRHRNPPPEQGDDDHA